MPNPSDKGKTFHIHYDFAYCGTVPFNQLLRKHGCVMDWYDSCVVVIYRDEDSSNEPAPAEGEDSSGTDDAYVKHLGLFRDAMATLYEVKMDEGYAKALEADIVVLHEEIAAWKKLFSAMDSSDEEVRCVCPYCYAEGKCFVSKARAKELKEQELMEESCPFGDNCAGEDSSED